MADYSKAFKITIVGNEGQYNPGDGEAETYRGIDRSQNPKWSGWQIVDIIKRDHPNASVTQLNLAFSQNAGLQANVLNFYKLNYWNTLNLDLVSDQQLANNLFDGSVNPCIDSAANVMQLACNAVQPGALVIDGVIGPKTIACINSFDGEAVFNAVNAIRAANYRKKVQMTPRMAQWLSVWLRRLVSYIK
jgi:hypothetical protein